MPTGAIHRLPTLPAAAVDRCWKKANAPAEWGLTLEEFRSALERSVAQRFSGATSPSKMAEAYIESLHAADLALACACIAGNAAAWDFFVAQYRPELYRAARAIAGQVGESTARELADSLYADLYGMREREGQRKSLFVYFHGRSKLGTWLRAILAQRHVDEIRRLQKTEPLKDPASGDERSQISAPVDRGAHAPQDPERDKFLAMMQAALLAALEGLAPRDRLRMACYYVEELTLAEIGRLLDEHESTVSRQLERTRSGVRRRVEGALREEKKLSEAQVRLCYEYAREEWPFDLTRVLSARE